MMNTDTQVEPKGSPAQPESGKRKPPRIIISGGGSGGHVFPAIAIADAIKSMEPDADILFVGAEGKIEMEKVPKAGYPIKGLWISGFQRRPTLQNLLFPVKLLSSLIRAWEIVRDFRPDVVVGVGGFASGPVLEVAGRMGIPTLIQEQNSFAGVTNRLLAKKAARICVAYDQMERYFPASKLVLTGNPVRKDLMELTAGREAAAAHFGLDAGKPVLFVFGGSLGARSINEAVAANAGRLARHPGVQVLWQTGQLYADAFAGSEAAQLPNVRALAFVDRMDLAYVLADVVICRAGALTLSELCLVGKPAILIPSPNVAEDHQTKNARALSEKDAALSLPDDEASGRLIVDALALLENEDRRKILSRNIKRLARPDAATHIAREALNLVKKYDG